MLKGHSPNELSRRTELLNETPSDDQTNVVSFASGTKVVRNDPCPCGSGKKFKKCCLRSS
nr:SEC-C metal-binding domain-containing protein [Geomicrobium sediminis]